MEVEKVKSQRSKVKKAAWLNPTHPNFERWKRARDLSIDRGKFVKSIVEKYLKCENLNILDLGSGEGGTSIVFSEKNKVVSYDKNPVRFKRQKNNLYEFYKINGNALFLPFKKNSFDLIILQDVIEHITGPQNLIIEINKILKPGGIIYVSTPNKFSIINIISDPHWGVPVISLLKRDTIKSCFIKYFRKDEINRKDLAELLSLTSIQKYFSKDYEIKIETKHSVEKLLNGDKGIVWSNFHLNLIRFIKKTKLEKLILLVSNDKDGIINKFFSPTFYIIMKRL
jgi:SAM-dependent methyltransferase